MRGKRSSLSASFFLLIFSSPHLLISFLIVGNVGNVGIFFNEVTLQAGIHFKHTDGRNGQKFFIEPLGAGAAFFDYDNDGDLDLYFVNGNTLNVNVGNVGNSDALYRNNGDGSFTEVTVAARVDDGSYGFGCSVGDYDNDGFLDLYITNFGANILYHNNGDGSFSDITEKSGVGDERCGTSTAFADYDNDGDLDLFVANYVDYKLESNPKCAKMGVRVYCSPDDFNGSSNALYQNNGDGTFTEVTKKAGIFNPDGKGLGVIWADYDNDGDLDVFVANDRVPNMLYKNNGDGSFKEVALFAGVAVGETGVAYSGMGTSFGDYDNDGWLDLIVTNFQDEPNTLYQNEKGTFADATYSSRLGGLSLNYLGWGVDFVDLDSDGYQDIFVANGHVDDNIKDINPTNDYQQQNQVFRNLGDGTFQELSDQSGPGLLLKKVSRGAAFGDYDDDGDLDILVTNLGQTPDLLRNESGESESVKPNQNHWLMIQTIGAKSNRNGIGARVKVVSKGFSQIREVRSGSSYLCQSDLRLHFGLGIAASADLVEIRWPSGIVERLEGIKANQFLKIVEGTIKNFD
jgi:hypothetical protein